MNLITKLSVIALIAVACLGIATVPTTPHKPTNAQCVIVPEPGSCNSANGLNQADQHVGSDMPRACGALSSARQTTTGMPSPCG